MAAKRGSEEHRRRISEGVKRAWARRKALTTPRPAQVTRWQETGEVAPELAAMVEVRARQAEAMVQDLGGAEELSALERAILDGWLQAQVAADVEFGRLARGETEGAPERLLTALNTARANLMALGLRRRAKPVMGVQEYLAKASGE